MRDYLRFLILILFFSFGCTNSSDVNEMEKWKSEIMDTEKAFNDMVQEEGLARAFEFYAAEDGAIRRGKKVIKGKQEIAAWYENDAKPGETLTWTSNFVDVSNSGDMAYTYGDYTFTYFDTLGVKKESKGIFHTVWKRQADRSWKFVWD